LYFAGEGRGVRIKSRHTRVDGVILRNPRIRPCWSVLSGLAYRHRKIERTFVRLSVVGTPLAKYCHKEKE